MRLKSILLLGMALLFLPTQVLALKAEDRHSLNYDSEYYWRSQVQCSAGGGTNSGIDTNGGSWNSGLQPPFILEQFAIETLKDVGQKRGAPTSSTVTQEHVTALLAFMFGEGGDINNQDLFNPLNSGLNAPDLIDGAHSGSGVQSFKSFDAGVEATARTIVGSNQSRLADTLVDRSTTAEQFMHALTYYQDFPGNQFWAAASQPPNQDSYYQQRLQLVQQVRTGYKDIASLVIGTPEKEAVTGNRDASKLQFDGGSGTVSESSASFSSCGCSSVTNTAIAANPGCAGVAAIVNDALLFSWPDSSHGTEKKPEYAQALIDFNNGIGGIDCGQFVSTVMHASGADPNYPATGTSIQEAYVRAHPEKYDVVNTVSSTADLLPGDILIVNQGGGEGHDGHTYIYVGPQPPNGYNEASASLGQRAANLGNAVLSDVRGNYMRARLK